MFNQFFLFTTTAWVLAAGISLPLLFCIWLGRKRAWHITGDLACLFVFILFFLVSFAFRLQPGGFTELIAFIVGPIGYLVIKQQIFVKRKRLASIFSVGAYLLIGLATFFSLYGLTKFIPGLSPRLAGVFVGVEPYTTYPNTLALFLLAALPFHLVGLRLKSKDWRQKTLKTFVALAAVINVTALFLTFSRGAYLALLGGSIIIITLSVMKHFYRKRTVNWRAIILGGLILFAGGVAGIAGNYLHKQALPDELQTALPVVEDIGDRISDSEAGADKSTDERWQFWQGSLALIKAHPLTGIGSDGFKTQYPLVQQSFLGTSTHPHNLILKITVENGIPAGIAFSGFLLLVFWQACKAYLRSDRDDVIPLTVLAAFSFMQLHFLVDYNINAALLWGAFWFVILLAGSQVAPSAIKKTKTTGITIKLLASGLLTMILVVTAFHVLNYRQQKIAFSELNPARPGLFYSLPANFPEGIPPEHKEFYRKFTAAKLSRYSSWAELWHVAALIDPEQSAIAKMETALRLNSQNFLDWHFEFLLLLHTYGQEAQINEKEGYYFDLISNYVALLKLNSHNTIATHNPAYAGKIVEFYLNRNRFDPKHDWLKLSEKFTRVKKIEELKFERLFPSYSFNNI